MSLPFSGDPASAAFPRVRPVRRDQSTDGNQLAEFRQQQIMRLLAEAMSQLADQQTEITRLRGLLAKAGIDPD